MPPTAPPTTPTEQIQWLVDRAAISDLLIDFARALDDKDWAGYAANYAENGVLAIRPGITHAGRTGMADFVAASLGRYAGTHHLSTNHAITIDEDSATTRSYLVAAHVLDADDPYRHADGAGWYRCRLQRTQEGWRFTHVTLEIRYLSGEALSH
ncbi:nuclear transport factor 2 family protein [Streptomyces sp. NPDC005329]|uniref:nuclear transport factor 2 family protein n=1 Tax=Streptomyces sp. NPDC005329 TaxID=3157034 RepID=UPI0033BBCF24